MPLLCFNLTTSPVTLAAGVNVPTIPPSDTEGQRGSPVNVTAELHHLSNGQYLALQAQVDAELVEYIWSGHQEYATAGLDTGSDIEENVLIALAASNQDKNFGGGDLVNVGLINGRDPLQPYSIQNRITVGSDGGDQDFDSIKAAVDHAAAQGCSAENPFTIIVHPGTYFEDPIICPPGVRIVDTAAVFSPTYNVFANNPDEHLFQVDPLSEESGPVLIKGGLLAGVTAADKALVYIDSGKFVELNAVFFMSASNGAIVKGGCSANLVGNIPGGEGTNIETMFRIVDDATFAGINCYATAPEDLAPFYITDPVKCWLRSEGSGNCNIVCQGGGPSSFAITPDQVGVNLDSDFGSADFFNGTFAFNNVAVRLGPTAVSAQAQFNGDTFKNNTINFKADGSDNKCFVNVGVDARKTVLTPGAEVGFTGIFYNFTDGATDFIGNAAQQFQSERQARIGQHLIDTQCTGLVSGGEITEPGGLFVDVAAGVAWFRRHIEQDLQKSDWEASTGLALTPSAANYVYVNANTLLPTVSTSPPSEDDLLLNIVYTRVGSIKFNHRVAIAGSKQALGFENYIRTVQQFTLRAGLALAVGSSATKFSIGSGSYYLGTNIISFAGASDTGFTYYYGTNSVSEALSQTTVSTTQYDNAGTLTAMTGGFYRADTVYLTSDGRVSVIYGTAQFAMDTDAAGSAPASAPSFIASTGFLLGMLVVQQGVGITEIVDLRTTRRGNGSGAATYHSSLLGLDGDDHEQYFLTSGARSMAGTLNLGSHSITGVTTINGIDISDLSARLQFGGSDALPTGTPIDIGTSNAQGTNVGFALVDHRHNLPFSVVQTVLSGASSHLSINNQKIQNLASPTVGTDAANLSSVNSAVSAGIAAIPSDGSAITPSLRTLGSGAAQAMAGNTRLDQITAPTAAVSLNSQKIVNLATPTLASDASTKDYVDTSITAAQIIAGGGLNRSGNTIDVVVDNSTIEIVTDTVRVKDAGITGSKIAAATVTDSNIATANKDGTTSTPSLRTLGTGAQQAMAGNTRLDQVSAPTAPVSLNSQKITSLATPTLSTDAATKGYVDSLQPIAGDGLSAAGTTLHVVVDNSTLEIVTDTVKVKDGGITSTKIANSSITDSHVAAANKDGLSSVPSLRTLGTLATQALPGNIRLDQLTVPTAAVNVNGQKVINLATPSASSDAATKGYVDANGSKYIQSVQSRVTSLQTTTSATFAGLVSQNIATGANFIKITVTGGVSVANANQTAFFKVLVDSADPGGTKLSRAARMVASGVPESVAMQVKVPVTAATHTIDVLWRVTSNTAKIDPSVDGEGLELIIEEVTA